MELEPGKIWVGGLSWKTTDVSLREHFEAFGEVAEATVAFVKASGQPRGFGFVMFVEQSVVSDVVRQTHIIDGKHVDIKRAVPREMQAQDSMLPPGVTAPVATAPAASVQPANLNTSSATSSTSVSTSGSTTGTGTGTSSSTSASTTTSSQPSSSSKIGLTMGPGVSGALARPNNPSRSDRRKIFVGGLAATVDNNVFREYFERYGQLEDVIVMMDRETRRSRGFGFIVYTEEPPAHQVMADAPHTIHNKVVEVKLAVPKPPEDGPAGAVAGGASGGGITGVASGAGFKAGPPGPGGGGGGFRGGGQPMHMQHQQYPGIGMGRGMGAGGVGGGGGGGGMMNHPGVQMGGVGIGGIGGGIGGGPGIGGPVGYVPNYGQQMMQPQPQYYAQPMPPGPGQQQWPQQGQPAMVMPQQQQQQQQPVGMWPQQMQPAMVGQQPMYGFPQQQGGFIQPMQQQQMLQYPQQPIAPVQIPQQQPPQQQPPQQQPPQQQVAPPVDPRRAARDAAAATAASSSLQGGEGGSVRGTMPRNEGGSGKDSSQARQFKPF
jgi:RNA recognition motif-containing protein